MKRLLQYFTPENYQLFLDINKHQKMLHGRVIITGKTKAATTKLHAKKLIIEKLIVNGRAPKYNYDNKILSFRTKTNADITIEIIYRTALNENMEGAYLSTYQHEGREERIVATQFESHYARQCFPCIDEPAAKATFELVISVPDSDDTVLSNMPVRKTKRFTSGNVVNFTTFFKKTPKMPTYLLAFVVGRFQRASIKTFHGVKITTYCPLNHNKKVLKYANQVAANSLDYFEDLFKTPYPLPKLDQVALPDFEAGAMENWGLVTYRESCLLADRHTTLDAKKSIAIIIAHELSHQWFGNLVTMQWWDDLWLNESFASIMEYYAIDMLFPHYHIWEDFYTGDCVAALRRDALDGVQAVKQDVSSPDEISTLFDGAIVYAKGARLILMLIKAMGEKAFFTGVKEYFKKYRYQNTVGDNLWAALQPHAKFNVQEFMQAWISQPGYPVLKDGIAQRFLLSGKTDDSKWPIPEIKDDLSGHYIINYSDDEFSAKLAKFKKLSTEQRLRLLIDRALLAKTPLVPSASLLPLLNQFRYESSPAVWEIIASIIGDLKIFFEPESFAEQKFKNFIIKLITSKLHHIGIKPRFKENPDRTKIRSILLSLALYAEDGGTIKALSALYQDDYTKINPEIRAFVLRARLMLDEKLFGHYLLHYQNLSDPELKAELLFAISQSKTATNCKKLIKLLENPAIIRPQDHLSLFLYLRRNPKTQTAALDWLTSHWDYLNQMTGEKSADDYPRLTATTIRTEQESGTFFDFFDPLATQPSLTRTIAVAHAEIDARLHLLKTDTPDVISKLRVDALG